MSKGGAGKEIANGIRLVTIDGFKGFQTEARVPLRPLTIIMGANNSGKSAILKSIASLCQTKIHKRATGDESDWVSSGPWFDLGSSSYFVNSEKKKQRSFSIGFGSEESYLRMTYEVTSKDKFSCDLKKLSWSQNNITYNGIKYNEWIKSNEFLVQFSKEEEQSSLFDVDEDETYIFIQEGTTTEEIIDAMKELDELLAYGTEDAKDYAARCARLKQVYSKFNQEITLPSSEKELEKILDNEEDSESTDIFNQLTISNLLGANVTKTSLSISKPDIVSQVMRAEHLQRDGSGANPRQIWNWLLRGTDNLKEMTLKNMLRHLSRSRRRNNTMIFNPTFFRNLENLIDSEYLGAFRLEPKRIYDIRNRSEPYYKTMKILCTSNKRKLNKINDSLDELVNVRVFPKPLSSKTNKQNTQFFEVTVGETATKAKLHLSDVGYGISQLLPILSHLNSNNTLIMEEAESNLHPRAQAKLMDIIVKNLDRKNPNPQIIMESHSEHFLLRIQQLISEGKFSDEDVALIFVARDEKTGTIVHHAETKTGEFIEDLPNAFEFYDNYNPTGSRI